MASVPTLATPQTRGLRERLLGLAGLVTTPLVPSDYLDRVAPLRTGTALRGRIVALLPETARRRHRRHPSRAATGRGHRPASTCASASTSTACASGAPTRSPRAAGRADGCIAITVKAVPDGVVSTHLVRRARVGTLVHLDQAAGDFVLPPVAPAKALFVTAGTGITPGHGHAARVARRR